MKSCSYLVVAAPSFRNWPDEGVGKPTVMNSPLSPARRDELVEGVANRLRSWGLSAPAILLLQMHAPLAFLGSQILIASQPFVSWLTGDCLIHDLAYLLEQPENVERLIARLEERGIR